MRCHIANLQASLPAYLGVPRGGLGGAPCLPACCAGSGSGLLRLLAGIRNRVVDAIGGARRDVCVGGVHLVATLQQLQLGGEGVRETHCKMCLAPMLLTAPDAIFAFAASTLSPRPAAVVKNHTKRMILSTIFRLAASTLCPIQQLQDWTRDAYV